MQDRYLFRGKRVDNGRWVVGAYVPKYRQDWAGKTRSIIIPVRETTYLLEIDPSTIGQCTGLKDKNGTLVFEGDILTDVNGFSCTVVWYETEFLLDAGAVIHNCWEDCEVVGNIHDKTEA